VLFADDWSYAQLRARCGLPDTLFVDAAAADREGWLLQRDTARVFRFDPTPFYPDQDAVGRQGTQVATPSDLRPLERLIGLLGRLRGCRILHLSVLRNTEEQIQGLGYEQQITLQDATPLYSLPGWYEHVDGLIRRHLGKHHSRYCHILALVSAELLTDRHLPALRELLGQPADRAVINQAYLMMSMVELGEAPTHVGDPRFTRRYWAAYVGRLLLACMYRDLSDEDLGKQGGTVLKVWRALAFQYDQATYQLDQSRRRDLVIQEYQDARESPGTAPPLAGLPVPVTLPSGPTRPLPPLTDGPGREAWLGLDAGRLVTAVTRLGGPLPCAAAPPQPGPAASVSPLSGLPQATDTVADDAAGPGATWAGTVASALEGSAHTFASALAAARLPTAEDGCQPRRLYLEMAQYWRRVADDHRLVNQPIPPPDFAGGAGPDQPEALDEAFRHDWATLCRTERERAATWPRLRRLAKAYDRARKSHVEWRQYVWLVMLPVVLLSGYAGGMLTKGVVQFWTGVGVLPEGIGFGGYAAPWVVAAAGALGCLLAGILTTLAEDKRGNRSQELLLKAVGDACQGLATRQSALQRLASTATSAPVRRQCRLLVARAQALRTRLVTALHRELQPRDLARDVEGERLPLAEGHDSPLDHILQPPHSLPSAATSAPALTAREVQRFQAGWRAVAAKYDSRCRGHLPLCVVLPLLRRFRDELSARTGMCLTECPREVLQSILQSVTDQRAEMGYFSCQLPPLALHKTARVLLGPKGVGRAEGAPPDGVMAVELPEGMSFRAVAYYYEEITVGGLSADDDGIVRVMADGSSHG